MTDARRWSCAASAKQLRLGDRAPRHRHQGLAGRGALPARRQRRRQVDADQDPLRRLPAERGRDPRRRHAGRLRAARATRRTLGIATVFQDLGMIPLMSITRNFFLGREPTDGPLPLPAPRQGAAPTPSPARRWPTSASTCATRPRRSARCRAASASRWRSPAPSISARKVLILDEPTSALGVHQAAMVLKFVIEARLRGLAVIFISHNIHHAYPVGDVFTLLNRGRQQGTYRKVGDHPRRGDGDHVRRRGSEGGRGEIDGLLAPDRQPAVGGTVRPFQRVNCMSRTTRRRHRRRHDFAGRAYSQSAAARRPVRRRRRRRSVEDFARSLSPTPTASPISKRPSSCSTSASTRSSSARPTRCTTNRCWRRSRAGCMSFAKSRSAIRRRKSPRSSPRATRPERSCRSAI